MDPSAASVLRDALVSLRATYAVVLFPLETSYFDDLKELVKFENAAKSRPQQLVAVAIVPTPVYDSRKARWIRRLPSLRVQH